MYYLQSRYYSPEWGRFVNADGLVGQTGELLSHNMFTYCLNNPVNREDPSGYISKWIEKYINSVVKNVNSKFNRSTISILHYEARDLMNGFHPSYAEVTKPRNGWVQLPPSMSVYHDNKKGKPELKFVHPSGREAVFDGDTKEPITDPKYKATYNYVNPYYVPNQK